jgi:hypothetical protein
MSLSHPGNFDLVCQNGRFAVTRDGATWLLDGQYRDEVGTAWAPSASGSHTTSLAMWDYTTTLHANGAVYSQLNPWWFRGNAGAGLDKDLAQPQRWRVAFPPDAMGGETQVFGIDGACALALGDGRSRLPRERWSAGACVQHVPAPVSVSEHGYNLRSRCM